MTEPQGRHGRDLPPTAPKSRALAGASQAAPTAAATFSLEFDRSAITKV